MTISLTAFAWLFVAMFVGASVQGAVGLGLSLIAVPIGAIVAPSTVPGVFVVASLPLSVLVLVHEHRSVRWRSVATITCGRVPGALLGVAVVVAASDDWIGLAAGVVVLLGAAITAFAPAPPHTPLIAFLAGAIAGTTGTAAGIDGPPMGLYLQREPHDTIRATLAACFVAGTPITVIPLAIAHKLHWWQCVVALGLLPAVVLGHAFARRVLVAHVASRSRQLVLAIACVAGISAVLRSLLA